MRQRLLLGITILILVLAFSIGAAIGMKAIHKPGEIWLTQAAEYALAGDMEQAVPLAREAYERWTQYRGITSAFADHTPMDEPERLFREMLVYAETGEDSQFAACCVQTSAMLRATYETHGFSLKNIF